jgi:hypothetical protein
MTNQHPIIPTLDLVLDWQRKANHNEPMFPQVAAMAAQWGADQELEACCDRLDNEIGASDSNDLRADRRPKPPSLKQQALKALDENVLDIHWKDLDIIRRALEQLDD